MEIINNLLAIHNLVDNFCLFYLLMKCLWVDHNFLMFIIHYNYLLNNFCKQFLFCSSLPLWMFIIQNLVCETNYLSHILDLVQCLPEHCSYNQYVFSKYPLLQYKLKFYSSVNTPSIKFICQDVHKKQTPWNNLILKSVQILVNIFSSGPTKSTNKR